MPKTKFNLYKEIQRHKFYRKGNKDEAARKAIDEVVDDKHKTIIVPGQLILFKYLNPKTKDELEFYDASPCTIFFGAFNSKEGKRVLGFNIHYFPPLVRYKIMDKIFRIYKPVYMKYFESGIEKEISNFDYKYLMDGLKEVGLEWAVRMYIPARIGHVQPIPPKLWPTAMYTEGWFHKETRARILRLFSENYGKIKKK